VVYITFSWKIVIKNFLPPLKRHQKLFVYVYIIFTKRTLHFRNIYLAYKQLVWIL